MTSFFDAATAYPTIIYTALLGVVLFYWVLALIGVVDIDSADIDTDLQADAGVEDIGELAAYLVAFGLNGVPFSVVVTLITLTAWTLSCLAGMWLLPLVPTTLLQIVVGSAVLLASLPLRCRLPRVPSARCADSSSRITPHPTRRWSGKAASY